jgi:hypothetical protein
MGEHYAGSVGVVGSNPIGSTTSCFGILTFGKRCIDCRFHFLYDFDIVNHMYYGYDVSKQKRFMLLTRVTSIRIVYGFHVIHMCTIIPFVYIG